MAWYVVVCLVCIVLFMVVAWLVIWWFGNDDHYS